MATTRKTAKKTTTKKAPAKASKAKAAPSKKPTTKKAASKPAAKKTAGKKLSALDAAAQVLGASKEPLTTKQMIEAMAAKGLWTSPGGKTTWATLYTVVT